jgi:DNA-binding LacI/PurR family transcriptional regulator
MKDAIDDLDHANIPFVLTNCYADKDRINYVGLDDHEIGCKGAAYLIGRGHTRVALVSGAARSPMTP